MCRFERCRPGSILLRAFRSRARRPDLYLMIGQQISNRRAIARDDVRSLLAGSADAYFASNEQVCLRDGD